MKYILRKSSVFVIMFMILNSLYAQEDIVLDPPTDTKILKAAVLGGNVSAPKTVRVAVHFPLKTNGTGNFTETTDYYGVANEYTGYWLAEKFIERCNYFLSNNKAMIQQLSYSPIPVKPINVKFELSSVFFHRNDALYNSSSLSTMYSYVESDNRSVTLNIFFPVGSGSSAAYGNGYGCYAYGITKAYDRYRSHGDTYGIDSEIVRMGIHEIGHNFDLDHPNRSGGGDTLRLDGITYWFDDLDDTPTTLELYADGYTKPYNWCDSEGADRGSNNFMAYTCTRTALTPDQIQVIHDNLQVKQQLYPCGFDESSKNISTDVSTTSKLAVAQSVTTTNMKVHSNRALIIYSEHFQTVGSFEVEAGAKFEVRPQIKCNW